MELTKDCSKCLETKPRSEFSIYNKSADGLQPYCRMCKNAYQKEQRLKKGPPVKVPVDPG